MAGRGKKAKIDLAQLERLCALQVTEAEIATFFNVSSRTIERCREDPAFAEAIERGRARGKLSLRRAQWRLVEKDNAQMQIWLGKQILNQRDQISVETDGPQIVLICAAAPSSLATPKDDEAIDAIEIVPLRGLLE